MQTAYHGTAIYLATDKPVTMVEKRGTHESIEPMNRMNTQMQDGPCYTSSTESAKSGRGGFRLLDIRRPVSQKVHSYIHTYYTYYTILRTVRSTYLLSPEERDCSRATRAVTVCLSPFPFPLLRNPPLFWNLRPSPRSL